MISLGSTSSGWTITVGPLRGVLCPTPAFSGSIPGSIPGRLPAVVGIRRGHAGLPAIEMRFCPRPWSAGLSAQRPGAEGLLSQLRYHAKPTVAVVRRMGFSFSYKPSATQVSFFFLEGTVCVFKRGCGHARILHDMSSLRVHTPHEGVPMLCCQKVTRSVHDVLAIFLTYLTGLYTSQRIFSIGLTQILEGVWLECPEHNIRQIQNPSGTSVQAPFRAPRQRGSFQSVASRV